MLIVTQDALIDQIAAREDIDAVTVQRVLESAGAVVFDCLSFVAPSEEVNIKLFSGISIKRKYIKEKKYSKGMFRDIDSPEHVNVKACLSKYYNSQVNQRLFNKQEKI